MARKERESLIKKNIDVKNSFVSAITTANAMSVALGELTFNMTIHTMKRKNIYLFSHIYIQNILYIIIIACES